MLTCMSLTVGRDCLPLVVFFRVRSGHKSDSCSQHRCERTINILSSVLPQLHFQSSSPSRQVALKLFLPRSELVVMVFMKEFGHFSAFPLWLLKMKFHKYLAGDRNKLLKFFQKQNMQRLGYMV